VDKGELVELNIMRYESKHIVYSGIELLIGAMLTTKGTQQKIEHSSTLNAILLGVG
jgi:hypothetical protein